MLPKKSRGFKKLKANKKEDKSSCKTEASDISSLRKKLKQKASGLKITLDECIVADSAEINCGPREVVKREENYLLDRTQLENLKMEEDKGNQLMSYSANSGTFNI